MTREEIERKCDIVSEALNNYRNKGQLTQCPVCKGVIHIHSGVPYGSDVHTSCQCGFCNFKGIGYENFFKQINNYFAFNSRRGIKKLTDDEVKFIKEELKRLEIPEDKVSIDVSGETPTCYNYDIDIVRIGSNVFPDINGLTIVEKMPVACVLAHEYYGHAQRRQQYIDEENGKTDKMPRWEDEAIASRDAARYTPNLTDKERWMLLTDSNDRCAIEGKRSILSKNESDWLYDSSTEFPFENKALNKMKGIFNV